MKFSMTSNQLKAIREAKGWSQERLAAVLGLSVSVVSKMEQGQRNITQATVDKLNQLKGN